MAARNEEANIGECLRRALAVLDGLGEPGEVLVIEDGSTDRTFGVADEIARHDPRVRIVRNPVNRGIAGFNRQIIGEARGEWVFYTSADGEFDFNDAPRFLRMVREQDLDAMQGYRRIKQYTLYRIVVSWMFNNLPRLLFGANVRDAGCIRLLRRSAFGPIELFSNSAFLNTERLLVGRRKGFRIGETPVEHFPRMSGVGGGSKPRKVLEAFVDLIGVRLRWFRFNAYYGDSGAAAPRSEPEWAGVKR